MTPKEAYLLNKGYKYDSASWKKFDVESLAVELDATVIRHRNETKLQYELTNTVRQSQRSIANMSRSINNINSMDYKTLSELRKKLNKLDIVCTVAILLNNAEYIEKTLNFFTNKNCTSITSNHFKSTWLSSTLIPLNPDCLPKIHKVNRPIVTQ